MTQTTTFEDYLSSNEKEIYTSLVKTAKSASEDTMLLIESKISIFMDVIRARRDFTRNVNNEHLHKELDLLIDTIDSIKGIIKIDAIRYKVGFYINQIEFVSEFR